MKSEGARKRFIAELHAKRNLEQLKERVLCASRFPSEARGWWFLQEVEIGCLPGPPMPGKWPRNLATKGSCSTYKLIAVGGGGWGLVFGFFVQVTGKKCQFQFAWICVDVSLTLTVF